METQLNIIDYGYMLSPEEIVDKILDNRGIKDRDSFLNPDSSFILPYEELPNIDKAKNIVLNGVLTGKKFMLNVDSDTDGVTSGTIMFKWLRVHDVVVSYYVSEGKTHGTSDGLTDMIEKHKPDILIIMDSLDSNLFNYSKYKEMGIQVVVLDHHDIDEAVPYDEFVTLVSSNKTKNPELSGAGVVWKFCKYLDSCLGENYSDQLVDYAAIGLLADVMSVDEDHMENRAIINLGLRNLQSEAVKKIIKPYEFNSTSVLFSIAPLINASCRYNNNLAAFKAIAEDYSEFESSGDALKALKQIKCKQDDEVKKILPGLMIEAAEQQGRYILCEIQTEGDIKGLIANKLANAFEKPAIVVIKKEDDKGKVYYSGSGRAPGNIDFKMACNTTRKCKASGHPTAFGIFIDEDKFEEFKTALETELQYYSSSAKSVDMVIDPEDITDELINNIKDVSFISGENFKVPTFLVETEEFEVSTMSSGKHLVVEDSYGIRYIKWNAEPNLIKRMRKYADEEKTIQFIGTLENGFIGRKWMKRLIIDDFIVL